MAKDASGWQHHWKATISHYKRRKRLYENLVEARQMAMAEHLMRGHLCSLSHCWQSLEADASKPAEVFTQLLASLCSHDPSAQLKAWEQLASYFDALQNVPDPELQQAIESALCLAIPIRADTAEWAPLFELAQQFPAVQPWLVALPWEPKDLANVALPEHAERQNAIKNLLESHQAQSVLSWQVEDQQSAMALGLAARLGETEPLNALIEHEDEHPEWVLPAYWLASTRPALERLYSALSLPHLASSANVVWQLMSGLTLEQQPAIGIAGGNKKAGPLMPDLTLARQWWDQHSGELGEKPWMNGKPVTTDSLATFLTQQCGLGTLAAWWLWQFERKKMAPDLVFGWHHQRVQQLKEGLENGTR